MHCFNSSDPVAVNATVMFDFNKDNENLWSRRSQDVPLPPCSSSSTPLDSQCAVCLDRIVHAVCRNLTGGVNVIMEAGEQQVKISKSECPKFPHDEGKSRHMKMNHAPSLKRHHEGD
ncbi:uncharacterized protein LOC143318544 isoform X2 [Chaetodon auriga]|uniref:uncharacterized protein LOC143318544 isoform X2 n=1 Tax=Chaetodon auriga TaxID=39042 RepID=UPI004032E891